MQGEEREGDLSQVFPPYLFFLLSLLVPPLVEVVEVNTCPPVDGLAHVRVSVVQLEEVQIMGFVDPFQGF